MIISNTCFATANFTSANGIFLVPNVSVDGTTTYESVTLQLDLATGNFTILDATLKDTSFSETALDTISENGMKVDFFGCARSGHNQISCLTKIVSTTNDQKIIANRNHPFLIAGIIGSSLFDNLGREYDAEVSAFDQTSSGGLEISLIQGVPAEVKFIFNDIDIQATAISAFKPVFVNKSDQSIQGNFRNINF